MERSADDRRGLQLPRVIFGTSCLGNLYKVIPYEEKLATVRAFFANGEPRVLLDSAGKYGAGLALEIIGRALRELGVPPEAVAISNKLGWRRVPLRGPEPTFEPGVWEGLEHDAEQAISHDGILVCWEQGNALLGSPYRPNLVSVHDPDEFLARGGSREDLRGAYQALAELKSRGEVRAVGVGSKDWHVIREIAGMVDLDWAMLACSLTVMSHPPELLDFIAELHRRGVTVINSAVFHSGFLTGGAYFDYRAPEPEHFAWRARFWEVCARHTVSPASACVQFGLAVPGVVSVALNTSSHKRVPENVALGRAHIPAAFWRDMKAAGLISKAFPFLGV
ncbi:MAG: aldo/keto reductase [Kiritimatiellae bacterium]|nr:aldo/keto reductase [Kiritimatiellia bacterium]